MRLNIYTLFILGIILLGFLWFLGNVEAAKIEESWSSQDDPTTSTSTLGAGYGLNIDGDIVYDDEGNGADSNDPVVDPSVTPTEDTWRIRITVEAYAIYVKSEALGPEGYIGGYGFVGWICNEVDPPQSAYRTEKVATRTFDIQSIMPRDERDVLIAVSICVTLDFIEVPVNTSAIKVKVNDRDIAEPNTKIGITSLPAGEDSELTLEFKLVYFDGKTLTWKKHVFKDKVLVKITWKPVETRRVEIPSQPQWCVELDQNLPEKIMERRSEICSKIVDIPRNEVTYYEIASIEIVKV